MPNPHTPSFSALYSGLGCLLWIFMMICLVLFPTQFFAFYLACAFFCWYQAHHLGFRGTFIILLMVHQVVIESLVLTCWNNIYKVF